jgi:hypothetical protein
VGGSTLHSFGKPVAGSQGCHKFVPLDLFVTIEVQAGRWRSLTQVGGLCGSDAVDSVRCGCCTLVRHRPPRHPDHSQRK